MIGLLGKWYPYTVLCPIGTTLCVSSQAAILRKQPHWTLRFPIPSLTEKMRLYEAYIFYHGRT